MLRRRIRFKKRYWYRARLITNCYGVRVFDQFLNLIWSASVRSVLRTNVIPNFPSVVFFYISSRKITFCQLFVLVQCGISQVRACLTNVQTTKKFFYIFVPRLPGYPLLSAVHFSLADTVATRILASCGLQNTKCPYEFSIIHIGPTYRVGHSPPLLRIVFPETYKFDWRKLPRFVLSSYHYLIFSHFSTNLFPFLLSESFFQCNEQRGGDRTWCRWCRIARCQARDSRIKKTWR